MTSGVLPHGWGIAYDADGDAYYYNEETGATSWLLEDVHRIAKENEEGASSAVAEAVDGHPTDESLGLPPHWHVAYDEEGDRYFYNSVTNETSWYEPSVGVRSTSGISSPISSPSPSPSLDEMPSPPAEALERKTKSNMALYISSRGIATSKSQSQQELLGPIEPHWEECFDAAGDIYYMNTKTGQTSWQRPTIKYASNPNSSKYLSSSMNPK